MANTPGAGLYTSNQASLTGARSRVLYSGRGTARHQSGIGACANPDAESIVNDTTNISARLCTDDLRYSRGWWCVAAALDADRSVGDDHANSGKISFLNAVEQILSGGLLRCVEEDESRFASGGNQAAVEVAHFCRVSGCQADRHFRGDFAERRQHRDHAQNAERLNAR